MILLSNNKCTNAQINYQRNLDCIVEQLDLPGANFSIIHQDGSQSYNRLEGNDEKGCKAAVDDLLAGVDFSSNPFEKDQTEPEPGPSQQVK